MFQPKTRDLPGRGVTTLAGGTRLSADPLLRSDCREAVKAAGITHCPGSETEEWKDMAKSALERTGSSGSRQGHRRGRDCRDAQGRREQDESACCGRGDAVLPTVR
jgi:hypothetical protein